MNMESLLYHLAGTSPTEENPTPRFSPVTMHRGWDYLVEHFPGDNYKTLLEAAHPLFGQPTPAEHRAFRLALYQAYRDLGFTVGGLTEHFPDVQP